MIDWVRIAAELLALARLLGSNVLSPDNCRTRIMWNPPRKRVGNLSDFANRELNQTC